MASINGKISLAECMAELKAFRQVLENVQTTNNEVLDKLSVRQRKPSLCEENKMKVNEMKSRGDQLAQTLEVRDKDIENLAETVRGLCGRVDGMLNDFSSTKEASRRQQNRQHSNDVNNISRARQKDCHTSARRRGLDTGEPVRARSKHHSTRIRNSDKEQTERRDVNDEEEIEENACVHRTTRLPPVTMNSRGYKSRLTDERTDNRLKTIIKPNIHVLSKARATGTQVPQNIKPGHPDPEHDLEANLALARRRAGKSDHRSANFLSTESSKMPGLDEEEQKKMAGLGNSSFIANFVFQKWYTYAETEKAIGSVSGLSRGKGPDTVLVLDTSASMEGETFTEMIEFARDFVTGVATLRDITEIPENVAVATIGEETKVWIHVTSDYDAVRATIRQIQDAGPRGRSPLAGGLLVALAGCLGNGKPTNVGEVLIHPRIILLSDGRGSPDHIKSGADETRDSNTDILTKTIVDTNLTTVCQNLKRRNNRVHCIPFGDSDMSILEKICQITSGKVYYPTQLDRILRLTDKNIAAAELVARVVATFGFIPSGDVMRDIFEVNHNDAREEDKEEVLELSNMFVSELPDQVITREYDDELPAVGTRVRRGPGWKFQDQDSRGVGTVCSHAKDGSIVVEWDYGRRYFYEYKTEPKPLIATHEHRVLVDELIATGCRVKRSHMGPYTNEEGGPDAVGVVVRVYLDGRVVVRWPNKSFSNLKYGFEGEFDLKICEGTRDMSTLPERRSAPPSDSLFTEAALPSIGEMNRRNTSNQN
ncbi:uncharacterized protein [Argopecten irradians]|uniref:uncharacterized protein n=1 Tax=Argopecten irradians TaxID=31199 RepID=UPI00371202C9